MIKNLQKIYSAGPFVLLRETKGKGRGEPEDNLWGNVSLFRVMKQL